MYISPGVSNTCLFASALYYKLNKGFSLGFLFKPLGGLHPPCGLNKKASENYPLFITYQLYQPQYIFKMEVITLRDAVISNRNMYSGHFNYFS